MFAGVGTASARGARHTLLAVLLLIGCAKSAPRIDDGDDESAAERDGGSGASSRKQHARDAGDEESGSDGSDAARPSARRDAGGGARADASAKPFQPGEDAATCATGDCLDAAAPDECADAGAPAAQPAVLFVYDRSSSMNEAWTDRSRADAVHRAVAAALTPLASTLTVGALFFPSVDPDAPMVCVDPSGIACTFIPNLTMNGMCAVTALGEPDQIDLRAGDEFLGALDEGSPAGRYTPISNGSTPLLEALQAAQNALAGEGLGAGTTVVVITDGEPNCMWDPEAARTLIRGWLADGIELYFIALPTTVATTTITSLRAPSGPNPTIVEPADPAELEQDLTDILSSRNRGQQGCPQP